MQSGDKELFLNKFGSPSKSKGIISRNYNK